MHTYSNVKYLEMIGSDHRPIIGDVNSQGRDKKALFMTTLFYQWFWSSIKGELVDLIQHFFRSESFDLIADALTKPLSRPRLQLLNDKIGLSNGSSF